MVNALVEADDRLCFLNINARKLGAESQEIDMLKSVYIEKENLLLCKLLFQVYFLLQPCKCVCYFW